VVNAIRQARPALVEKDNTRSLTEALQPAGMGRLTPPDLQMRNEAGHQDKIDDAVAKYLVCNVNLTAFGIADRRLHRTVTSAMGQRQPVKYVVYRHFVLRRRDARRLTLSVRKVAWRSVPAVAAAMSVPTCLRDPASLAHLKAVAP
jgi:hypothetical protein